MLTKRLLKQVILHAVEMRLFNAGKLWTLLLLVTAQSTCNDTFCNSPWRHPGPSLPDLHIQGIQILLNSVNRIKRK